MIWLFLKMIVFEAWGRGGGPWEGVACVAMGIAGIWLSLISLADLVAWVEYLIDRRNDSSAVSDRVTISDDQSP